MVNEEILQTLKNPLTYGCQNVKHIQTATAHVFLTGDFAYKTCRTMKLPFLDYSSQFLRMKHLRKEFEMNKEMTPSLYLELLKVANGKLVPLTSPGFPDEYVYKMKQMPENATMKEAMERGEVTAQHIKQLAVQVAQFHKNAQRESEFGTVKHVTDEWNDLFAHVQGGREGFIAPLDFAFVKMKILTFIEQNKDLISQRVREGKAKFCHGDLHGGNVFVGDELLLFDRITFNKRFPCSDTMSEVAFLAMDLEFHGRKDLATIFVNAYSDATGEQKEENLLTFYKCYRSWIRGCIHFFDKEPVSQEYFNLAISYAKQLPD